MRTLHLIGFLVILSTNFAVAQSTIDSANMLNLEKIAQINQGESYVTFPFDIGNIEPLIFEANVNPSFKIRERKDSRLMAVLTAQIFIRMYNEYSNPVKTPSYLPQLTVYFMTGHKDAQKKLTLFGKIAHHSNGQDGDFYNTDDEINLRDGNFATNFMEFGVLKSFYSNRINAYKFFKTSIEIHPKSWMLPELHGQYSGLRWHNSFLAYKLPLGNNLNKDQKANFSVKLETNYMLDQINNWKTFDLKRLNTSLIFYYHPKFLEDVGFFAQFYHGSDYYNIYFQHQISSIRFGIMTEVLRF